MRSWYPSLARTDTCAPRAAAATALLIGLFAVAAPHALHAQSFPVKPVRIVSPYAPGGGVDIMARLLAPKMMESLGVPVIIESRPGAGSNIGMEYVVKSAPDGYTVLMNTPPVAINMSLYRKLGFDTTRDLAAVSVFSQTPNALVLHPSVPARSVKELVALARAKPGSLNFSSGGNGTTQHLSGELFKLRTATAMVHVPYKGSSPSMTALVGGQVELSIANIPSVIEFVRAGRLRPLATTTAARTGLLPQVPTMKESGVDMVVVVWYSLHVPAATPREIVAKLADAVIRAAQSPDTRERLAAIGAEPVGYTPDEAARHLRDEVALWAGVVKAAGARPD
ncbi:MAG: tripartite tricarboxylate transporter substrate binding protein [Burkholderiales bacterium]|nr:tripartite tricarboxylate transporter substrate binding protein [Burkholderiales bacterium]